jgi:hypothetical protein
MRGMDTISNKTLAAVTGGGEVDTSQQSQWIDQRMDSYRRNGLLNVQNGSRGLATRNGNWTPNVVRFPGGG